MTPAPAIARFDGSKTVPCTLLVYCAATGKPAKARKITVRNHDTALDIFRCDVWLGTRARLIRRIGDEPIVNMQEPASIRLAGLVRKLRAKFLKQSFCISVS